MPPLAPSIKPLLPLIQLKTQRSHILPILVPCDKDLPLAKFPQNLVRDMEPTIAIRDLDLKKIGELREMLDSDMHFQNVSDQELLNWISEYPELVEHKDFRYEYNFLSRQLIIKCMPTPTHHSLQYFFIQTVVKTFVEKVELLKSQNLVTIGAGTSFNGFEGDWCGSSEKLPDAFIRLKGSRFPVVVCKAGWAEKQEDLKSDAKLWLLNTGGETKIVIMISFTETRTKSETDPTSENSTSEASEHVTGTGGGQSEDQAGERALIESINESTKLHDLANQLLDLNKLGGLGMPLIGKLQASLYVYRANEDHKDIIEVFNTAILPPPPANSGAPHAFQITMKDIFGEDVPKDMKPTDPITFSLPVLGEIIEESLPGTARFRANRRANNLLKAAGVWE